MTKKDMELEREVAQLKKDKAMLDWMENQKAELVWYPISRCWLIPRIGRMSPNLRSAIRAAMKGGAK